MERTQARRRKIWKSKFQRRTCIIGAYTDLIKRGIIKEGSFAMNRWNYLRLNNYRLNT